MNDRPHPTNCTCANCVAAREGIPGAKRGRGPDPDVAPQKVRRFVVGLNGVSFLGMLEVGNPFGSGDPGAQYVLAVDHEKEIARLNKWADGFSDRQLTERHTAEAYQRELRGENERLQLALTVAIDEVKRLDADAANERAEKDSLAAIVRTRDAEIERITRERDHLAFLWDRHNAELRARDEEIAHLTEDRDFWKAESARWQQTAHKVEEEVERLTRELTSEKLLHLADKIDAEQRLSPLEVKVMRLLREVRDERDRLRAALEEIHSEVEFYGDYNPRKKIAELCARALAGQKSASETPSLQAPIARIVVANDKIADAQLYAPGLPVGAHDLYCQPEAVAPMMRQHPGATPLSVIADKLDTAEELTDCERGCAADALRKLAEQDVLHVRLREYRMPARELPDDDLPEKVAEQHVPHFPDNETLRRQILGDPDDEPTAGNVP